MISKKSVIYRFLSIWWVLNTMAPCNSDLRRGELDSILLLRCLSGDVTLRSFLSLFRIIPIVSPALLSTCSSTLFYTPAQTSGCLRRLPVTYSARSGGIR